VKVLLPDQHIRPSQRLLLGIAVLAAITTLALWPMLGRWAFAVWLLWTPVFIFALRYLSGSWIRVNAERGLSWCLLTPFGKRMGNIELHASDIAELRLEASLLARFLGLSDLQIVRRDGEPLPRFRFFERMDELAEAVHAYLQQG
jgi:hypothetical protein